jgi:hypothetical protein
MKFILLIMILSQTLLAEKIWVNRLERTGIGNINQLECSDSLNCYAFADLSSQVKVHKSTDQGKTWNLIYVQDIGEDLNDIDGLGGGHVLDSNNLYILGFRKVSIERSSDGGKTFKPIRFGELSTVYDDFYDIEMYDAKLGAGNTYNNIIITRDNWETYEVYDRPSFGEEYKRPGAPMFFIDSNNIVMTRWAGHSHDFVKFNIEKSEWTQYSEPIEKLPDLAEHKNITDIQFVNDSIAFGCGFQRVNESGDFARDLLWKTTDRGATWVLKYGEYQESTFGTQRIAFENELNGMAIGSWGKIIETTDGGNTWAYHDNLPVDVEKTIGVNIAYAGSYPIISTWQGGIYRLEEVDLSSKDEFILDEHQIKIRQTNAKLLISIEDDRYKIYDIKIIDINGNILQEASHRSGIGTVFKPIRLVELINGVYFYNISTSGQVVKTGKFSVIK